MLNLCDPPSGWPTQIGSGKEQLPPQVSREGSSPAPPRAQKKKSAEPADDAQGDAQGFGEERERRSGGRFLKDLCGRAEERMRMRSAR